MINTKFWIGIALLVIAVLWVLWLVYKEILKERAERNLNDLKKSSMSFREGLNLTGLPIVTFTNNDKVFNFLLDTGSNVSLINESTLKTLKYEEDASEVELYGIDGIERNGKAVVSHLTYEDVSYKAMFFVTDLTPTFRHIKKEHGVMLHGILGSDFFKAYRYVLDFNKLIAYSELVNKK